jgi:chromosome segregation ATPase
MDGDIKKDILDVRKVIERSTSKVSLRDLEKKGFRKVKVLRAGDINQLIYKAVQTVLAKQPAGLGEAEREQVLAEAKAEYERQTKQLQELQELQERAEAEKAEAVEKAAQIEQAQKNLEAKLAQANATLVAERNKILEARKAFEEEKRQLEREKAAISEKGFDAIQAAQKQVQDLQKKLEGVVPQDQYNQLHQEAREKVSALTDKVEEAERAARRAKGDAEEAEQKAAKLQARVTELEAELEAAVGEAKGAVDPGEIEKLRAEQREMLQAVMGAIKESQQPAAAAAAGSGGDFEKSFKTLQQNLTDQLRKFAGSGMKGGFDEGSTTDLGALLAGQADVQIETNIKDVGVKEQSAKGVKDKLSKLRNMRGGGPK